MRGLRTATTAAACLAVLITTAGPADAATRAPLPRLAKVGKPPSTITAGGAFNVRFRAANQSRRRSLRSHVTVRVAATGRRIGLPGKAVIPVLNGRRSYRGSRRYVLPAGITPGSYQLIACVKRSGVPALCETAPGTIVVPGRAQGGGGGSAQQPPGGGGTPEQPAPTGGDSPSPSTDPPAPGPDTTAAAVAITSPAQGQDLSDRKPLVEGMAGTAPGDAAQVTVRFSGPGGPRTETAPITGGGTWSVRPSNDLAPGAWSVTAEQGDAAGNKGTSAPTQFGINATLLAAGDIAACDRTGDSDTAALLQSIGGDAVAALGDLAYENGSTLDFTSCYDATWGVAKARTHPAIGNHEYETPLAAGYFGYFGTAAGNATEGYYSYDLGSWHVVVLNSNCSEISCAAGSPQANWLSADLAAHPTACTLAYWHHPLFNASQLTGTTPAVGALWGILDSGGADVLLVGHAHNYQRFAPQHANGTAAADGVREIVAGTGGYDHHDLNLNPPNIEAKDNTSFGVLELTLKQAGYRWDFHPTAPGVFTDAGSTACS